MSHIFGLNDTARARIIREPIKAWLDILKPTEPHVILAINTVWNDIVHDLMTDIRFHKNKGVMPNIIYIYIYILLKARWRPLSFNLWEDSQGSLWQFTSVSVSPSVVASALIESFFNLDLVRASNHHNGKGVENGIEVENSLRVLGNTETGPSKARYKFKCSLEAIMAASTWSKQRIHDIKPHVFPICPR